MALAVKQQSAWMTADCLAALPDDSFQYELDEGELIIMAPAGARHGRAERELFVKLYHLAQEPGLGEIFPSDTGFILSENPDTVRCPDIAFVRSERLPLETRGEEDQEGFLVGPPDLAVEVQSPSQSPADLRRKTQQYLDAGAQTVWVIYPRHKAAEIYESGQEPRARSGLTIRWSRTRCRASRLRSARSSRPSEPGFASRARKPDLLRGRR